MSRRSKMRADAERQQLTLITAPEVKKPARQVRAYGPARINRHAVWNGLLENPDAVIRQFGAWEGLLFYDRMLRQFAFLSGLLDQRIDRVARIERTIVAGDPNDDRSVAMAADLRRLWGRVRGRSLVVRRLLRSMWFGVAPVEKVWERESATGLWAPLGLYDLPPWVVKYGPDGEERILTAETPFNGIPVEPGRIMAMRWGTRWTDYGEAEARDVYLATWNIQTMLDFGSSAIETMGRPIPWAQYPETWSEPDVAEFEASLAAQFALYVMTGSKEGKADITFPGMNVVASGGAGRAELEFIRTMVMWIYIRMLGTPQTMDQTTGSRGLESVRDDIADAKTPAASDALDECLTEGWAADVCAVNWPNEPAELWPYFKSDTSEIEQGLNGNQAQQAERVTLRLAARQITQVTGEELLAALGLPRARAARIIKSTIEERDANRLELDPAISGGNANGNGSDEDRERDVTAA